MIENLDPYERLFIGFCIFLYRVKIFPAIVALGIARIANAVSGWAVDFGDYWMDRFGGA